jgi:hypothetical protein
MERLVDISVQLFIWIVKKLLSDTHDVVVIFGQGFAVVGKFFVFWGSVLDKYLE